MYIYGGNVAVSTGVRETVSLPVFRLQRVLVESGLVISTIIIIVLEVLA